MAKVASFLSSLLGGGGGGGGPAATVTSVFVYPIKSCRGISVPQAPITATGFRWDRQWMLVNAKGRAVTQRVEPKLALIRVELPPEAFAEDWQPTPDDHMVIRAPGMEPLKIPLASECDTIYDISVWEWSGSAYDEGAEAAEWFSTFFGNTTRLVRFKEESETRLTDPDYARGYKTMFSDGFPFLITSQGSLDALNEILKEPIPINRFRPKCLQLIKTLEYLALLNQLKLCKHIGLVKCCFQARKTNGRCTLGKMQSARNLCLQMAKEG
ncbi:unnamed protein product [Urochloa humidicola]